MIKVTFHGHACFSLEDGSHHVLIDPFITGNPQAEISADKINPTHILVSHGHGDHLGDAIAISKRSRATIVAPNELAVYCQNNGAYSVHNMHIGGSWKFEFGRVKLTPAWHGSAVIDGKDIIYTGTPCGFVVEMGGKHIYHTGDTGLFGDMKLIGEMFPLDCALLPIGDNFVMGPDDALKAAGMLQAKLVIPMHYHTFPVIRQDPNDFAQKLTSQLPGQKVKILAPGESVVL